MQAYSSREKSQLGPLRGQGLMIVPLWKGSDLQKGPGPYEEALTNIKILRSFKMEEGALIYACAKQQPGQWLIRATYIHRLGSGARLKAMDARNLPKPVQVVLRTKDKVATNSDELLKKACL
jgi:hypothetical protein